MPNSLQNQLAEYLKRNPAPMPNMSPQIEAPMAPLVEPMPMPSDQGRVPLAGPMPAIPSSEVAPIDLNPPQEFYEPSPYTDLLKESQNYLANLPPTEDLLPQTPTTKSITKEPPKSAEPTKEEPKKLKSEEDADLKKAQEATAANTFLAQMARASSQLSAGIAGHGAEADVGGAEMLLKTSGLPMEQYRQRQEQQDQLIKRKVALEELRDKQNRRDPNSGISKSTREFISAVYPDATKLPNFNSLPADDAERLFPKLVQLHDNKLKMEALKLEKARVANEKEDKRFTEFNNKITAEIASSRSAFGKAANNFAAAERIEALAAGRDPNELTTREIAEMAINLDGLFRGGQPTISGTEKLIPKTYRADAAKIQEYITNEVQGAHQGQFVRAMLETVGREKALAHDQVRRTQGKVIAGYEDLKSKNPDRWNNVMASQGLPSEGLSKETVDSRAPKTPKVLDQKTHEAPKTGFKKVRQNGKDYYYNPQTGESYEAK